MIYFTSDTHFGHANVIKYCSRPFRDVKEMDRELIRRWNARVGERDTVFHLGDFAFGPRQYQGRVLHTLRGRKVLIRGNHDGSTARMLSVGFDEVHDSLFLESERGRILMRHKPLDGRSGLGERAQFCGHVHDRWHSRLMEDLTLQRNVGVDVRDFEPKALEELLSWRS